MSGDLFGDMDVEYATTVADSAIRSMSQQSVPITPGNFSVWFDYAMGTSPGLRKTIDILIGNKRKFDASINRELYATFVKPHSGEDASGDFPEQLQGVISSAKEFSRRRHLRQPDPDRGARRGHVTGSGQRRSASDYREADRRARQGKRTGFGAGNQFCRDHPGTRQDP